jgi:hypothetical protein
VAGTPFPTEKIILGYSMTKNHILESQVNTDETWAGVYEHDDEVGYFYLYQIASPEGPKVTGAIHISKGSCKYEVGDLAIRWSNDDAFVGLFIGNKLRAAFEVESQRVFGGTSDENNPIPESVIDTFVIH